MKDLPFRTRILKDRTLQLESYIPTRPALSVPIFTMGLVLSLAANDFVRPPQAVALGRHGARYLMQAHFITSSEKGVSEPRWIGKVEKDIESELHCCQEDSLRRIG
jgi:hypothetical protein